MEQNHLSLGGFVFDRQGKRLSLRSPAGVASTDLEGFLRGATHLLKMDFDLEGSAELDGGLVFRAEVAGAGREYDARAGDRQGRASILAYQ
jgi:hypothetical protein